MKFFIDTANLDQIKEAKDLELGTVVLALNKRTGKALGKLPLQKILGEPSPKVVQMLPYRDRLTLLLAGPGGALISIE